MTSSTALVCIPSPRLPEFDLALLRKLPKRVQCDIALFDGRFWWDWKVHRLRARSIIKSHDKRKLILRDFLIRDYLVYLNHGIYLPQQPTYGHVAGVFFKTKKSLLFYHTMHGKYTDSDGESHLSINAIAYMGYSRNNTYLRENMIYNYRYNVILLKIINRYRNYKYMYPFVKSFISYIYF